MSESQVDSPHVEEIVTQVLAQLVQDGGDEDPNVSGIVTRTGGVAFGI